MTKDQVTAIIEAIRTTAVFIIQNGHKIKQLWQSFQDIIDAIPDDPPTPPGPTLPTVWESTNYYFNKSASGNYYFADNETKDLFSSSGYKTSYDDTLSYAVVVCKDTSTNEVRIGIPVVKDDVYLAVKNETGAAISLSYASISTCSSSDATVVTVYDSNNAAFNAFKYTVDSTDYYYVLDGTQTDWTNDLSSIGYSLTPAEYNAYLDNQNKTITWNGWYALYANGQKTATIPYDSGKTYTFVAAYTLDGTKVNTSGHTIIIGRPDRSYSTLYIIDKTSSFTAYRIEYTET